MQTGTDCRHLVDCWRMTTAAQLEDLAATRQQSEDDDDDSQCLLCLTVSVVVVVVVVCQMLSQQPMVLLPLPVQQQNSVLLWTVRIISELVSDSDGKLKVDFHKIKHVFISLFKSLVNFKCAHVAHVLSQNNCLEVKIYVKLTVSVKIYE